MLCGEPAANRLGMNSIALTGAPRREAVDPLWTGLLLGGLLFVPGALGFFYEGSSFASGTALMCVASLLLVGSGQIPFSRHDVQASLAATILVGFLISVHLLIANIVNSDSGFDASRAFLSLLLFGLIVYSVPVICEAVMVGDGRTRAIVRILCGLFAVIAIFSLLKIQPYTSSLGEKPSFPYTEPSFIGFSFPAILIFTMIRSSLPVRIIIIVVFLGLGYALSNFTIIAACGLAAAVTLPVSWLSAGLTALVVGAASLDLSYYTERLNFDWANSTNLSSLVYVQGWQLLQESLVKTNGWGLGFQQLGILYTNVPASIRINALLGRDANLQDGGYILSKTGSELGVLGLLLIAAYLYVAAWSFLKLRKAPSIRMSDGEVFARSCVTGYFVELFIRGTNYFTGTFVLLLAGLLYLYQQRRAEKMAAMVA